MIDLLRKTLAPANLKPQYLDLLLTRIDLYEDAFTSASYDLKRNYEIYELLGDASANKFLVWYFHRRFPQLNCPAGVKVLARLKINYASKRSFAQIADRLGFWPYVRASDEQRKTAKKKLLEDVFEAFIGVTESIVDDRFEVGVGFSVINDVLTSIFDKMPISLRYEDLYDAKTRLKELFDANSHLGQLTYDDKTKGTVSTIYRTSTDGVKIKLADGHGLSKADRQQDASKKALEYLETEGYSRKINYDLFCE